MANAVHNERLENKDILLENLVRTVFFIYDIGVRKQSNYFFLSSLNHLHYRIKAILRHGAQIYHHLIFLQSSYAEFELWLENALRDFSLINFLVKERGRIIKNYYEWAFVRSEDHYDVLVDCLRGLATRDANFISLISSSFNNNFKSAPGLISPAFTMPLSGLPVDILESESRGGSNEPAAIKTESKIKDSSPNSQSLKVHNNAQQTDVINVPEFSYNYSSPIVSPYEFGDLMPEVKEKVANNTTLGLDHTDTSSTFQESKRTKKISFLESGGFIQPPTFVNFPLPHKGQSLTSFLSSFSETLPELDRENAHFFISEAMISAIENLRVRKREENENKKKFESIDDHFGTVKKIRDHIQVIPAYKKPERSDKNNKQFVKKEFQPKSHFSGRPPPVRHCTTETEESEFEYWRQQPRRPPAHLKKKRIKKNQLGSDGRSESVISGTEVTSYSPSLSSEDENKEHSNYSAKNVALSLLRNVNLDKLPQAHELQWLVSESQAPQDLLPLPRNFGNSNPASQHDSPTSFDKSLRLRGNLEWAPPRAQIIFYCHPPPNLHQILEIKQKLRCAGCSMKIDQKYSSTFRYCHYLGRYFCTGCHTLKKSKIPMQILWKWDFSPYYVSNFSATLLESLRSDPVYPALKINPNLIKKVKFSNFRNYRIQLGFLEGYIVNCKSATILYDEISKLPKYYSTEVELVSLEDLVNLRFSTGLAQKLKDFVNKATLHVLNCELCKQLGFICEICKKDEIIFPFQIYKINRCSNCSSCFHYRCFRPEKNHNCPKCLRVSVRGRKDLTVSTINI